MRVTLFYGKDSSHSFPRSKPGSWYAWGSILEYSPAGWYTILVCLRRCSSKCLDQENFAGQSREEVVFRQLSSRWMRRLLQSQRAPFYVTQNTRHISVTWRFLPSKKHKGIVGTFFKVIIVWVFPFCTKPF